MGKQTQHSRRRAGQLTKKPSHAKAETKNPAYHGHDWGQLKDKLPETAVEIPAPFPVGHIDHWPEESGQS